MILNLVPVVVVIVVLSANYPLNRSPLYLSTDANDRNQAAWWTTEAAAQNKASGAHCKLKSTRISVQLAPKS